MKTHFQNTFHQSRCHPISHMGNDSLSSDSSCNLISPEYSQPRHSVDRSKGTWCQNQIMNITQSGEDLHDQEVNVEDDDVETSTATTLIVDDDSDVANDIEDTSLVEGRDYDIIHVYTVNPDVYDLPDSSDDVIEIVDSSTSDNDSEAESVNGFDSSYREGNDQDQNTVSQDGLDNNLDRLSNINEYYIDNENILDSDDPVVIDVDEYLIKSTVPVRSGENEPVNDQDNADLLRIEEIKRYLLEDITYTEFKPVKPCITLEDLDISEFAFNNDEDKLENANIIDDMPQLLTDEEVDSFLIINTETTPKSESEENITSYLGTEIERTLDSTIDCQPPIVNLPPLKGTCSRTNETNILKFCIEKKTRNDHYSSEKLHSLPNLKGGQSLPKPEVLPSRITESRHRSCKSKKVVYHFSSDEENDLKTAETKKGSKLDAKNKTNVNPLIKSPDHPDCRTKLSPPNGSPDSSKDKSNSSEILKSPLNNDSDNNSHNFSGSIKLIIKNKSEVILNCDKNIDKSKNSVSDKRNNVNEREPCIKYLDRSKSKVVNNVETVTTAKDKPRSKNEKALSSNKQDVQIPQAVTPVVSEPKKKKQHYNDKQKCLLAAAIQKVAEQPPKKKKISLQEYKLRRNACSKNSSATVGPKVTFPDMRRHLHDNVAKCSKTETTPKQEQTFFDPIKEAARKILMSIDCKKRKAEAIRKRDENLVVSKIRPLASDAEIMQIVGMSQPECLPVPIEKSQVSGEEPVVKKILKATSSSAESKSTNNLKIKKSDVVLKQNVFDNERRDKKPLDEKKHSNIKIDKERYKDITATFKSVKKQDETKILSNSLFASIQDVVCMKKASEEAEKHDGIHKLKSPEKKRVFRIPKTTIVREYDPKVEHGEDKVILNLGKHRSKPGFSSMVIQTNPVNELAERPILIPTPQERVSQVSRKRNDSDMSLCSDESPSHKSDERQVKPMKADDRILKPKEVKAERTETKKRSRSKDRYDSKYRRRSRSLSCGRNRSRSRSCTSSRTRYSKYRRSDSPYRRKRRSRSPYHKRRSPSVRRDRSTRSKSRSRSTVTRSKSSVAKKRKPTVSESSGSSTSSSSGSSPSLSGSCSSSSGSSSSSSGSSSSSNSSRKSRGSCNSYKQDKSYNQKGYRSFNPDRETSTPVEDRRVVFVGRLKKDITKLTLKNQFSKFGYVTKVRLHRKADRTRYGFVTYQRARDAWSAVDASSKFPQYDIGFGERRAFCRQSYADLDGREVRYTESAFHGHAAPRPIRRDDNVSFKDMLLDTKIKIGQRKMKHPDRQSPWH